MKKRSNCTPASSAVSETAPANAAMLMVGAAGRNAGKTTLACSIIERVSRQAPVVGAKITVIAKEHRSCPHGKGCGSCSALDSPFDLIEENDPNSQKDTARFLRAGARRSLWLRAQSAHLREGVDAMLCAAGRDAAIVCESTGARTAVEPGLFFITKRADSEERKGSARAAWEMADRIVTFDGNSFDLDVADISFAGGRWALREAAIAIVMAGGLSSRMGTDKALIEIDGKPMIRRIAETLAPHFEGILISAADAAQYSFLGIPVVADIEKGRGPLMGLASALAASPHELNFVQACDIPLSDIRFVRRMLREAADYDAVIPMSRQGPEPLFAVYRKSALPAIGAALQQGNGRISGIFDRCRVRFMDLPERVTLANLNTPAEYSSYMLSAGLAQRTDLETQGHRHAEHEPDSDVVDGEA